MWWRQHRKAKRKKATAEHKTTTTAADGGGQRAEARRQTAEGRGHRADGGEGSDRWQPQKKVESRTAVSAVGMAYCAQSSECILS